jgi:transforming growth factor-beta-induced protein
MRSYIAVACLALLVSLAVSQTPTTQTATQNIIGTANNSGLTSFVNSIRQQNLETNLNGTGPFTVFAPNNAAFSTFTGSSGAPTGNALTEALLYHVIPGSVASSSFADNSFVQTLQKNITMIVNVKSSGVFVNGVRLVNVDIPATNGVIHIIDKVLTVPTGHVVQVLESQNKWSQLFNFVNKANLSSTLTGTGPFTVFAPNNNAWNTLTSGQRDYLNNNNTALSQVLTYHVLPTALFSAFFSTGQVATVNGASLNFNAPANGTATINNNVRIVTADVPATNGVVHEIDTVLLPPGFQFPNNTNTNSTNSPRLSGASTPGVMIGGLLAAALALMLL